MRLLNISTHQLISLREFKKRAPLHTQWQNLHPNRRHTFSTQSQQPCTKQMGSNMPGLSFLLLNLLSEWFTQANIWSSLAFIHLQALIAGFLWGLCCSRHTALWLLWALKCLLAASDMLRSKAGKYLSTSRIHISVCATICHLKHVKGGICLTYST